MSDMNFFLSATLYYYRSNILETVYWSRIYTNRPHRRRRRLTEMLPSMYCSHWLNRSRCVFLTCLCCSFFSLPLETSWIWIGRRLASSISNGAMEYSPLFPLPAFLSLLRWWCHPSTSLLVRVGRIKTDELTGQTELVIHVFSMYLVRFINFGDCSGSIPSLRRWKDGWICSCGR